MLPFYNLNRFASILFVATPVGVMVALYFRARSFDRLVSLGSSGADYMAAMLALALLFLSVAGIAPWARLLSRDKSRVEHTRKAALVGAGACVGISCVLLLLNR